MTKNLIAELIGTFWLVLGGCGSAVLAANFGGDGNPLGIGLLGVSLAFGLTVLTGALRTGTYFGRTFQSCSERGTLGGRPLPGKHAAALRCRPDRRRRGGWLGALADRPWPTRCRHRSGRGRGVRHQRIRIALARRLFDGKRAAHRVRDDRDVPGGDHGSDPAERARGTCAGRDRAGADAHPPDQHSRDEYLSEPRALDRRCPVRRRNGIGPTLVFLGCPVLGGLAGGALYRWLGSEGEVAP